MRVNKDDPRTWMRYKQSMCQTCIGTCCTMPVEVKGEDLVRLGVITEDELDESRGKLVSRLKKQGIIQSYREGTQLFMLVQRPNGDCLYLDEKTRLCHVYDRRPDTCRKFPETLSLRPGFCPKIERKP